jgi:hypothetical protein
VKSYIKIYFNKTQKEMKVNLFAIFLIGFQLSSAKLFDECDNIAPLINQTKNDIVKFLCIKPTFELLKSNNSSKICGADEAGGCCKLKCDKLIDDNFSDDVQCIQTIFSSLPTDMVESCNKSYSKKVDDCLEILANRVKIIDEINKPDTSSQDPSKVTASTSDPSNVTAATSDPPKEAAATSDAPKAAAAASDPSKAAAATSDPSNVTATTSDPSKAAAAKSDPSKVTAATETPPESNSSSSSLTIVSLIAAVAILLTITAAVVYKRRRRTPYQRSQAFENELFL